MNEAKSVLIQYVNGVILGLGLISAVVIVRFFFHVGVCG